MKRWYGMGRVRYLGLARNACHLQFAALTCQVHPCRFAKSLSQRRALTQALVLRSNREDARSGGSAPLRSPNRTEGAPSTVLSVEEEAVVVAFRRHTLLPLDDCLYALQPTIPHLTRSSPASLPQSAMGSIACRVEGEDFAQAQVQGLSDRLFSYRHPEVRTAQGRTISIIVAIDRPPNSPSSNCTRRWRRTAADSGAASPRLSYRRRAYPVVTDNGTDFTRDARRRNAGRSSAEIKEMTSGGCELQRAARRFEYACSYDVDHG